MDAHYELWALSEYLKTVNEDALKVESELPAYLHERVRLAYTTGDEAEADMIGQEVREIQENILPRFYFNMAAVAIYSTLELCIADVIKLCMSSNLVFDPTQEHRTKSLKDIRKFFRKQVGILFCRDSKDWNHLLALAEIRNCITHAGGGVDLMKDDVKPKVKEHLKLIPGLQETSSVDRLMVRPEFLEASLEIVDRVAKDLMAQAIVLDDKSQTGTQSQQVQTQDA